MAMIATPDNIGTQGFQFIKAALRIGAQTCVAIDAACTRRKMVILSSDQLEVGLKMDV